MSAKYPKGRPVTFGALQEDYNDLYQEHSLCAETRDGLLEENTRLREGLKRLHYEWKPVLGPQGYVTGIDNSPIPGIMTCISCHAWVCCRTDQNILPECKPDCWLAKLLEDK